MPSVPFFISKRYLFSKRDSRFISLISSISIIGIALGVATLIIALSILDGFEETIEKKIVDFDSHIKITSYKNILPDYENNLAEIKSIIHPYELYINTYVSNLTIIGTRNIKEGVSLKGIVPEDHWAGLKNNIIAGNFDLDADGKKIIIGQKLANKLRVNLNDELTVFALKDNQIPSPQNLPNIMKFRISGIFESGMASYDDIIAYTNIKDARKLYDLGNNINGYDIRLNDLSKIDSLTGVLNSRLRYPHSVKSIYQIHRNIFTWIELQKEPIPIILGLIIIVAVFNIIATLLMIVLEKTNEVGVLKSIGANKKQIIKIFLYQGIFLAFTGIIIGNLLAYFLTTVQIEYNIITLPSSVYFVSSVPMKLNADTFLIVSAITLFLCTIVSFIPSYIASKVQPISSIRFN